MDYFSDSGTEAGETDEEPPYVGDTRRFGDETGPMTPMDEGDMVDVGFGTTTDPDITPDRTEHFELDTGRFRDPESGQFEDGGPPPEYEPETNRFRADDGAFKDRPQDHFDEPAEARFDSLEFPD